MVGDGLRIHNFGAYIDMPRFYTGHAVTIPFSQGSFLAETHLREQEYSSDQTIIVCIACSIFGANPQKKIRRSVVGEKIYHRDPTTMMPTPTNRELKEDNNMIKAKHSRTFQRACRIWFCPTDEKIAKELRKMSQVEREKVWADLSGNEKTSQFRKNVAEDPVAIKSSLKDFQEEIDRTNVKPAFNLAKQQSPDYVNSPTFRLPFLRACEYDGKRAGRMLIDHMETKRRLFGDTALGRDIRLDDLNEGDKETLSTGGFQFLRERDSAGRLILYYHRTSLKFKNRENFSRALFYSFMIALKDESVQKLGVVVIWDMMSEYSGGQDYEADRLAIQTVNAVPVRLVARYLLYDSHVWDHIIDVLNQLITPHARARTRSIKGSYDEIMQAITCLGISHRSIPAKENGEMDLLSWKNWIDARNEEESSFDNRKEKRESTQQLRNSERSCMVGGPAKRTKVCH